MKLLGFLVISFVPCFNYVWAMNQRYDTIINGRDVQKDFFIASKVNSDAWSKREQMRAGILFLLEREKAFLLREKEQAAQQAQRELARKREEEKRIFFKNIAINQQLQQSIDCLPEDVQKNIVQLFANEKKVFHQAYVQFKYAWGLHVSLADKKLNVFWRETMPGWGQFGDRLTGSWRSFYLKMHSPVDMLTMALWNMDKSQLLTAATDKTVQLSDVKSGKTIVVLVHDCRPVTAFFMHSAGSAYCAKNSEGGIGIVTCEEKTNRDKGIITYRSHTWVEYSFTLEQALLYKLLYVWLLVKKVNKNLFRELRWKRQKEINEFDNDLLIPYIKDIGDTLAYESFLDQSLEIWKTIPESARRNIWWDIRRIVEMHGK